MDFNERFWRITSHYPFNSGEMEIKRIHHIFIIRFYCRRRFNGYFESDIIPVLFVRIESFSSAGYLTLKLNTAKTCGKMKIKLINS